jgi:hypothetical protein
MRSLLSALTVLASLAAFPPSALAGSCAVYEEYLAASQAQSSAISEAIAAGESPSVLCDRAENLQLHFVVGAGGSSEDDCLPAGSPELASPVPADLERLGRIADSISEAIDACRLDRGRMSQAVTRAAEGVSSELERVRRLRQAGT